MNKMEFDIITPTKFSLLIEEMVQTKNISYMDSISPEEVLNLIKKNNLL